MLRKDKCIEIYKENKSIFIWLLSSFILTFILEIIQRGTISRGVTFYSNNTNIFIMNYIIMLAITSISLLFKRQLFYLGIISVITGLSAMASSIMTRFRGTPLTFADFYSISDGAAIAKGYLGVTNIIKILLLVVILMIVLVFIWKFKVEKMIVNNIIMLVMIIIISNIAIPYAEKKSILRPNQWDINLSYDENGFIYSFVNSYLSFKKKAPEAYNRKNIEAIGIKNDDSIEAANVNNTEKPNIIILQLEGFMDPTIIKQLKFDKDPIPNFRRLSEKYTSGQLYVPTLGGGTARSEFEVLTGMSLDYMSAGEIPHMTVLKRGPVESMAYTLGSKGYNSTFMHNFQGNFYGRNSIYSNLGFDRFISMEYMYGIEKNNFGWPKDEILLENIKNVIEKDNSKDFIYSIAVQTHGDYGDEYEFDENLSTVKVSGDVDYKYIGQMQDFVDDLVDVDDFVGRLAEYIESLDEPTILAVFSDHLPNLEIITSDQVSTFTNEEKYQTPYFICDNMGLDRKEEDMEAYTLSTYLLNLSNLNGGVINKFHNEYQNKVDYQDLLEILQYDMLYGDKFLFSGNYPYSKKTMTMGIKDINIQSVNRINNIVEVKGHGFNEFSSIFINDKLIQTELKDENTLRCKYKDSNINEVRVKQMGRYNKVLGTSDPFIIKK